MNNFDKNKEVPKKREISTSPLILRRSDNPNFSKELTKIELRLPDPVIPDKYTNLIKKDPLTQKTSTLFFPLSSQSNSEAHISEPVFYPQAPKRDSLKRGHQSIYRSKHSEKQLPDSEKLVNVSDSNIGNPMFSSQTKIMTSQENFPISGFQTHRLSIGNDSLLTQNFNSFRNLNIPFKNEFELDSESHRFVNESNFEKKSITDIERTNLLTSYPQVYNPNRIDESHNYANLKQSREAILKRTHAFDFHAVKEKNGEEVACQKTDEEFFFFREFYFSCRFLFESLIKENEQFSVETIAQYFRYMNELNGRLSNPEFKYIETAGFLNIYGNEESFPGWACFNREKIAEIKVCFEENKQFQESLKTFEKQKLETNSKFEEFNSIVSKYREEIAIYSEKIVFLEAEIQKKNQEVSPFQAQVIELNALLKAQDLKHKNSFNELLNQKDKEIDHHAKKVEQEHDKFEEMKSANDLLLEKIKIIEKQCDECKVEKDDLISQIKLNKQVEEEAHSILIAENNEFQKTFAEIVLKNSHIEEFLKYLKEENTQLRANINTMEFNQAEISEQRNSLATEIEQVKKQNQEVLIELRDKNESLLSLKSVFDEKSKQNEEINKEAKSKNDNLEELKSKLDDKIKQNLKIYADLKTKEENLSALKTAFEQQDIQVQNYLQKMHSLENEKLNIQPKIKELENQLAVQESKIASIAQEKHDLEQTNENLLQEISQKETTLREINFVNLRASVAEANSSERLKKLEEISKAEQNTHLNEVLINDLSSKLQFYEENLEDKKVIIEKQAQEIIDLKTKIQTEIPFLKNQIQQTGVSKIASERKADTKSKVENEKIFVGESEIDNQSLQIPNDELNNEFNRIINEYGIDFATSEDRFAGDDVSEHKRKFNETRQNESINLIKKNDFKISDRSISNMKPNVENMFTKDLKNEHFNQTENKKRDIQNNTGADSNDFQKILLEYKKQKQNENVKDQNIFELQSKLEDLSSEIAQKKEEILSLKTSLDSFQRKLKEEKNTAKINLEKGVEELSEAQSEFEGFRNKLMNSIAVLREFSLKTEISIEEPLNPFFFKNLSQICKKLKFVKQSNSEGVQTMDLNLQKYAVGIQTEYNIQLEMSKPKSEHGFNARSMSEINKSCPNCANYENILREKTAFEESLGSKNAFLLESNSQLQNSVEKLNAKNQKLKSLRDRKNDEIERLKLSIGNLQERKSESIDIKFKTEFEEKIVKLNLEIEIISKENTELKAKLEKIISSLKIKRKSMLKELNEFARAKNDFDNGFLSEYSMSCSFSSQRMQ